jgi:DNA-binding response OmpR family regulator
VSSVAYHVLIVDDDTRLTAMVAQYLEGAGFRVTCRADAASGLAALAAGADAVLLDVMLPDRDGFEVCRTIRATSDVPVLMLTARGDELDRIVGLELGADDYLPKPFHPRELLARLRAVLRRTRPVGPRDILRYGRLEVDLGARIARIDGEERRLTTHQFAILAALAEHPGRVLSRERILELARGDELEAFDRSIDVHVSRIRAAIEDDPRQPRRILTHRGVGYVFAEKQP